jgi:hypothetical protein
VSRDGHELRLRQFRRDHGCRTGGVARRVHVSDSVVSSGARFAVSVDFEYSKGATPVAWRDQVMMTKEGARWLIDDVVYRKAEGFGNGFGDSLRKALAPGNAC